MQRLSRTQSGHVSGRGRGSTQRFAVFSVSCRLFRSLGILNFKFLSLRRDGAAFVYLIIDAYSILFSTGGRPKLRGALSPRRESFRGQN